MPMGVGYKDYDSSGEKKMPKKSKKKASKKPAIEITPR
jgi:hypothetical protein